MKCIEFLYFYLLPEQSPSPRSVSSTSSSSGESNLFPPSPLSSSTSSNESDGRISPSPVPHKKACSTHADIDINFVPQTPRKPPQPSPGYLTPSTTARRVSASTTSTPSLPTVPASPRVAASPSSHHLASMAESPHDLTCPSPREKRSSSQWARPDHADGSTVGLGFGLPKSSSIAVGLCQSDETAIDIAEPPTPTFSDPFSSDSRSSSGSSTVLASPRSPMISRSSTQPSLTIVQSSPRDPSTRQTSVRRVSRSPLAQSLTPGEPSLPDVQAQVKPLPSPQIKHSRTQSHFSGLPPAPPVPVKHERRQSLAPPSKPSPVESHRSPSRPHRAFPAGLTRGLPSSASSPNLASPLRASKRIPSDKRPPSSLAPVSESPRLPTKMVKSGKDLRSVEEKKELVSRAEDFAS